MWSVSENVTYLLVGISGVGFLKGGEAVFEFPEKSILFWMTDPWDGFRATDGWLLSQFFHRPTEKVFSRCSRISSLACFPEHHTVVALIREVSLNSLTTLSRFAVNGVLRHLIQQSINKPATFVLAIFRGGQFRFQDNFLNNTTVNYVNLSAENRNKLQLIDMY